MYNLLSYTQISCSVWSESIRWSWEQLAANLRLDNKSVLENHCTAQRSFLLMDVRAMSFTVPASTLLFKTKRANSHQIRTSVFKQLQALHVCTNFSRQGEYFELSTASLCTRARWKHYSGSPLGGSFCNVFAPERAWLPPLVLGFVVIRAWSYSVLISTSFFTVLVWKCWKGWVERCCVSWR